MQRMHAQAKRRTSSLNLRTCISTGLEKEQREAESLQDASSSLRAEKDAMCKRLIALQEALHNLEQEQLHQETGPA